MKATVNKRSLQAPDDYMDLVRRYPLRPIRTKAEYDRAHKLLVELSLHAAGAGLTSGETDYFDMLGRIVREYDEEHSSILKDLAAGKKATPLEMLRYLVEESGMNTVTLGKLVGGSGQASLLLQGKRDLSKANIRALAAHFHVSTSLFI